MLSLYRYAAEKPLRLLGACGDGFSPCTLDGNDATRHFTVAGLVTPGCQMGYMDILAGIN